MVTGFNPAQLSSWGTRIFNGANGIKSTAVTAKIYGGVAADHPGPDARPTPTTPAPTTPAPTDPGADDDPDQPPGKACTAALVVSNTWPGGYQAAVTVKAGTAMISGWKTSFDAARRRLRAERLVRHLRPVRHHRDRLQRRLERAARLRGEHHLRLRRQRHGAELRRPPVSCTAG